ncbi:hypothetical protein ACFQ8T_20525 [Isoptericola sp. NPDC056618]|uniref:hypothetical protein n=1 Tax=Isoptericola sp. NPDC056618 TaxID=3345878 RepID=UPI0036958CA3
MVDLTEPPAQSARGRAGVEWGRVLALLGVAAVALAAVPFVSYLFLGGVFGGDGGYALVLVPVVVAAALGGLVMGRQGRAGVVLGAAGPVAAIVTCGAYFLATSREPMVAVGWIAVAVGPLAAAIAALGLPGRWRLAGLVVLVLTLGAGATLHHAGETEREDAALARLTLPYVLDDPDLVMYDAQVGETYSTVSYAGPGYTYRRADVRRGPPPLGGLTVPGR